VGLSILRRRALASECAALPLGPRPRPLSEPAHFQSGAGECPKWVRNCHDHWAQSTSALPPKTDIVGPTSLRPFCAISCRRQENIEAFVACLADLAGGRGRRRHAHADATLPWRAVEGRRSRNDQTLRANRRGAAHSPHDPGRAPERRDPQRALDGFWLTLITVLIDADIRRRIWRGSSGLTPTFDPKQTSQAILMQCEILVPNGRRR